MIERKLATFLSGQELKRNALTREELERHDMRFSKGLRNTVFEQGAHFHSGIINPEFTVFLGAYSYMNDLGYVRENTFIGRYCSIGRRVTISAGIHPMHGVSTHPSLRKPMKYNTHQLSELGIENSAPTVKKTRILNDVWIGDGAIVMPGVEIGNGAVIGANAVVTKNVPDYAVVGGTPAHIIKYRFPESVREKLAKSQWWNLPHDVLTNLPSGNIFDFLCAIDDLPQLQEEKVNYYLLHEDEKD